MALYGADPCRTSSLPTHGVKLHHGPTTPQELPFYRAASDLRNESGEERADEGTDRQRREQRHRNELLMQL